MKTCPDCGEQNLDFKDFCTKCGASLKREVYSMSPLPSEQVSIKPDKCFLSIVFYILAGLSLAGGIVGVFILWPRYGEGYIPSLTALIFGIVSSALFCAIGKGLEYLHGIHEYLETLVYMQQNKHE